MNLLEKLNRVPPIRCRLLARKDHGYRLMSVTDLMAASGLSRKSVIRISRLDRWDNLTLDIINRFSRACNVDLLAPWRRRDRRLIASGKMVCYERMNLPQRKMVARLVSAISRSASTKTVGLDRGMVHRHDQPASPDLPSQPLCAGLAEPS